MGDTLRWNRDYPLGGQTIQDLGQTQTAMCYLCLRSRALPMCPVAHGIAAQRQRLLEVQKQFGNYISSESFLLE